MRSPLLVRPGAVPMALRRILTDTATVMGPGKWLGLHIWDIRVISFTKSYLQVCCSRRGHELHMQQAY